jgi:RHS repeat-associated protein
LLSILLFASFLQGWMNPGPTASASSRPHSTPPSFTFQKYLSQGQHPTAVKSGAPSPYPQPPHQATKPGAPSTLPPSAEPATMKPITQALASSFLAGSTGVAALDLKGSDGRLELQLPPAALDVSRATVASGKAPAGSLTLQVTQIHGHFEGMLNLLGKYQVQVVDSQGQVVGGIMLRTPVTLLYHYQPSELLGLGLDPAHVLLSWPSLLSAAQQAKQPTSALVIAMRDDPTRHTLTAPSSVLGPGPFTLGGDPLNQMAPIPHLAEVQGNNGQLSYSYPLQVVPGSGGYTPQLALSYSSVAPNDRHSNTSPADDVGDGFSLSLGSITTETYPTTPTSTWYFINGIDNVGDRLLQYDSTNKLYYTEHLSYLRIQQLTSSITGQPCFDVWDKAGTFYEAGCTADSLEYSMSGTTRNNYRWNVDRIIAPNEGPQGTGSQAWRIILVKYLQDCNGSSTCSSSTTVRDAVIKQITYGYNTSFGTLSSLDATAGTIDFTYLAPFSYSSGGVTWATAYTYGTGGNDPCSPPITTTLRCDDPIQKSGGFNAPTVLGTFTLKSVTSYLNTDSASSNAAYGYSFAYSDSPFITCTDPITGTSGYCAGEHLLTQFTPIIYQGGTAHSLRATTFSYSPVAGQANALTDTYYDSSQNGAGGTPYHTATSWQYLTDYQDLDSGIGAHITYARAYSNTDGTPTLKDGQGNVTDDRYDALYCTSHASDCSTSSYSGHYAHPDDHAWSVQVVTTITSWGQDSSALGQASTTFNYYRLAKTGAWGGKVYCYPDQYMVEQDCVGDNWLPSTNDNDWQDYYHSEFRGFAQVWRLAPANDLTIDYYFSTEGWDQPATDPGDYLAGQVQQEEHYQGGSYDATKLLSRTVNTYPTLSNPNDASACYTPSGSAPFAACDIVLLGSRTTEYDETNSSNAPWAEHDYTYDDYDTTNGLKSGYHNLTQEVISGSNLPTAAPNLVYPLTKKWTYATNAATPGGWIYYTVETVKHSELDDANAHVWQCQYTAYDEGNSNPTPTAGWPTTVQTYSSSNCAGQTSPLTTTYQDYDAYGNLVASVDGFGAATPSLYNSKGCTTSSTIEIDNSAWTQGRYTSCASYDTGHYEALPTSGTNAFGQATTSTYDATQGNALSSTQDPNSQTTSYSYSYDGSGYIDPNGAKDYLGNTPGGTATFYDALGRVLAVRDPNYGSSGEPGITCSTMLSGTYTACTNYTVGQVSGDSNYYTSATSIDPNQHLGVSYLDALGRTIYTQQDSGIYGGTPTANAQTTISYNALDKPISVVVKDLSPQTGETTTSVTTTAQYDDLGRLTQLADPDRGTHTYSYDADGRVISDVSGTRTIGTVYDLLGRVGCVQDAAPSYSPTGICTSGANPYVQNTYDTTVLGSQGTSDFPVGRLTQSLATTRFPSSNTATTSTIPSGQGFTTTQVYDSTTGVETGLSNNGTATATLATLSYSSQAQLASLNFLSSTSGALATEQFGYDGNLRLSSMTASWQGGSGNSGTIFSQNLSYGVASNLTSLSTTQAAVPGSSTSGGSETQVFCYDEQNRLTWSGNTGTSTCTGNGTPSVSGNIGGYSYLSAYTHLGQLWQGPLSGGGEYQYLYCSSNQPHQLTGLYAIGATCANKTGQVYTSSDDSWGNVTGRSFSGTSGTLSYDLLDHLTKWYVSGTNQEQYIYDASGQRVLRRTTSGSSTTLLVYVFGLEEHQYGGAGANQWNTYYYALAGRLLGALDGNGTQFYLTDALGSLVSAFTNAAGGAALKGNQLFGPYGNGRYYAGSINTAKGFTGQYTDALTGLDYFHARYYDPVVGVFLSADTAQGNLQGMNPYAYVNGNPETKSDPTGQVSIDGGIGNTCLRNPNSAACQNAPAGGYGGSYGPEQHPHISSWTPPKPTPQRSAPVVNHSSGSPWDRFRGWLSNIWQNLTGPTPPGEVNNPLGMPCGPLTLSFAPMTKVATSRGEKAIGSLHPGERVWAYNPKTHKMELEPVVHVWINHDNDLVDVTIASTIPAQHGKAAQKTSEVVHTNQKHPFLTVEKGFVPVSQLRVGMHVMKAAGGAGTITMLKAIPGTMTMYNLEVAQDHTFTVGEGEWIVHNCAVGPVGSNDDPTANITMQDILNNPQLLKNLSPQQVAQIVARDGGWSIKDTLGKSSLDGMRFNQWNPRGTAFTDKYIQFHEGGGRHGPNPYWKVSTNTGGTVRVDYEGPITTGGDTTGGDEGDIPDLIDP